MLLLRFFLKKNLFARFIAEHLGPTNTLISHRFTRKTDRDIWIYLAVKSDEGAKHYMLYPIALKPLVCEVNFSQFLHP